MIPDDAQTGRLFATAIPASDLARAATRGTGLIKCIWGPDRPPAEMALRFLRRSAHAGGTQGLSPRAWVDGEKLSDAGYRSLAVSPTLDDNFESWVTRRLGQRPFAVVINSMEEVDEALAQTVASYLAPVIHATAPLVPITIGCFMGRYDFTPFGVHKDENVTAALHFHLGPGSKQLFYWSQDKNLPVDVEGIPTTRALQSAESLHVEPGDGMVVSHLDSHVGRAPEPCVSLVLLFRAFGGAYMVDKVRKDLQWFRNDRILWGSSAPASPSLPESWRGLTAEQMYDDAFGLFRMAVASNGGLEASPLRRDGGLPRDAKLRASHTDVFPLLFREDRGKVVVAARGKLRSWAAHQDFLAWLQHLANGVAMGLEDTTHATNHENVRGDMLMCFAWLYRQRVLDVAETT